MSKAERFIELHKETRKLQPRIDYTKGAVHEGEQDTSFHAALTGDCLITISQRESGEPERIIVMDLKGSRKFIEWIVDIFAIERDSER